jgi:hypothetical protein
MVFVGLFCGVRLGFIYLDLFYLWYLFCYLFGVEFGIFAKWNERLLMLSNFLRKHLRIDSSKIPQHFTDQSKVNRCGYLL